MQIKRNEKLKIRFKFDFQPSSVLFPSKIYKTTQPRFIFETRLLCPSPHPPINSPQSGESLQRAAIIVLAIAMSREKERGMARKISRSIPQHQLEAATSSGKGIKFRVCVRRCRMEFSEGNSSWLWQKLNRLYEPVELPEFFYPFRRIILAPPIYPTIYS